MQQVKSSLILNISDRGVIVVAIKDKQWYHTKCVSKPLEPKQAGAEAEVSTPLEIRDLRLEIRENLKSEI